MQPTRSLLLLAMLGAGAGAAHADPQLDVGRYASSVSEATATGQFGNNRFYDDPAECTKAVDAGTKAGLKPTDTFLDGEGNTVLWKRAGAICTEYARLHGIAKVIDQTRPMIDTIRAFTEADGTPIKSVTGDAYRATVERVKPCLDIIDKAVKAGVPTDVKFVAFQYPVETQVDLPGLRKVCSDYVNFGSKAAAADDAREGAEVAAVKEKYGKLGITGDRLTYLVKWGHRTILGKGCVELTGKALKTATAFYDLGDDGVVWTVYKTQFKGDKQTKYIVKRFRRDGDYQCK